MDKIKAVYKADIYEYENGKIDILYECDKEKNKECNKINCNKDYCTHTLNKKYAKNFYKEEMTTIEQTVDDILINGKSIVKSNKYEQTRRRITRFKNNYNMSDKEIIEALIEEIEQDGNKIQVLTNQLESKEKKRGTSIKTIEYISTINVDSNTVLIFSIDGKLYSEDSKKLKETLEKAIGCKCILLSNRIKITNVLNRRDNYKRNIKAESTCPPIEIGIHPLG